MNSIFAPSSQSYGGGFLFQSVERKTINQAGQETTMNDLFAMIQGGNANLRLELKGEDLLAFSRDLINRTRCELAAEEAAASKEDRLLTKEEVKTMLGVCDTTLWHWARKKFLPTIKVGSKVRYRQSDVQKILNNGK